MSLCEPLDVSFDDSSMLHVTDHYNNRIQVLDQESKYVREYGSGPGQLKRPAFIHIAYDYVYVSTWYNNNVSVFTTSGKFVHNIGMLGSGPCELWHPCGLVVDTDGFVYVCDCDKYKFFILFYLYGI